MPIMSLRGRPAPGKPTAPIPAFGRACVCCNHDARGLIRTLTPQPNGYDLAASIEVPVCTECVDHALLPVTQAVLVAGMIVLGIVSAGLGVGYRSEGRDPVATGWAIAIGASVVLVGIVLNVLAVRRERRERRRAGHSPYLTMRVAPGKTELVTSNPTLIEELRRLNPDAQFRETFRERRAERKRVPQARAVSLPSAAATPEAEANVAKVVAHVTKNTAESLAAARALLASGEVSAIVVERRLAELEAVLGRGDLRARLRSLSPP